MNPAKIQLSPEETALVLKPDWILTKNRILQKVWQLLESVQSSQQHTLSQLPAEVTSVNAKISKGENYKGLPYLILDQPRYFSRDDIFAIRTLFWWGHFFSTTLHLSGKYKKLYEENIIHAFHLLQKGSFICINGDPWEHHFEADNFIAVHDLTAAGFEATIRSQSFIKLSEKIPLEEWNNAPEKLIEISEKYISLLK